MRITNILIKLVGALALLALTFSCTDDTYAVSYTHLTLPTIA